MSADGLVETSARAARSADPGVVLSAAAELRRQIAGLEVEAVERALAQGWSWSAIAGALGITKQAAHKRYARRTNPAHAARLVGERRGEEVVITPRPCVTGSVRQALLAAQLACLALNHDRVRGAHLLLGLLLADGPAAEALAATRADFARAGAAVRTLELPEVPLTAERLQRATSGQLPLSGETERALRRALTEAQRLGHEHIGVEHLLLALLREPSGTAMKALKRTGADQSDLERCLGRLLMQWRPRETPVSAA